MSCILSGRGLSVDIGQFLCWEAMCLSSVWQLVFWILNQVENMVLPQDSFVPMTLRMFCKYVILTQFGRPWIAVVVLICQDRLQHCGMFHWLSPGASVVVQTGQPYCTYVISPWYPGITIVVHSGPNHGPMLPERTRGRPWGRLRVRIRSIEKTSSCKFYPAAQNFTNRMLFWNTHIF